MPSAWNVEAAASGPKMHQKTSHHFWTGDSTATSTPSPDKGLHGQPLRSQLPPDGINNDPTQGLPTNLQLQLASGTFRAELPSLVNSAQLPGRSQSCQETMTARTRSGEAGTQRNSSRAASGNPLSIPRKIVFDRAAKQAPPRLAKFTSWPEE